MTCKEYDNESSLCTELLDRHRFIRNKQDPTIRGRGGERFADKVGRCNLRQMCAKEHFKYNFTKLCNRPKWNRSRTSKT